MSKALYRRPSKRGGAVLLHVRRLLLVFSHRRHQLEDRLRRCDQPHELLGLLEPGDVDEAHARVEPPEEEDDEGKDDEGEEEVETEEEEEEEEQEEQEQA